MEKQAFIFQHEMAAPKSKEKPGTAYFLRGKEIVSLDYQTGEMKILDKIPWYVTFFNKIINRFVKSILHIYDETYQNMLTFVYYSHIVAFLISNEHYDLVFFETAALQEKVISQFQNAEKYHHRQAVMKLTEI